MIAQYYNGGGGGKRGNRRKENQESAVTKQEEKNISKQDRVIVTAEMFLKNTLASQSSKYNPISMNVKST